MMDIYFDNIIFSLQKAGGISLYWSEILKRIGASNVQSTAYEFANDNIFNVPFDGLVYKKEPVPSRIARYLPFTRRIKSEGIFHSSYYRYSLSKKVTNITTVHDFTYEYFTSGLQRCVHSSQKALAIKKSKGIICVSENTKKDLLKFYGESIDAKIKVIYNGVSSEFYTLSNSFKQLEDSFPELVGSKYILYVGGRDGYKNFSTVLETLSHLNGYTLVVVGEDFSKKEKAQYGNKLESIRHYTFLSNNTLNVLYNNAFCLFYPSSYEGFGLPVLEAMKTGCPVIGMNTSSIPEITNNTQLLQDELNAALFAEKINTLKDPTLRKSIITAGIEVANSFSWQKCFDDTLNFYKSFNTQ